LLNRFPKQIQKETLCLTETANRCCNRAQWEIRAVADEMLRLVLPLAPHIFAAAGPRCLTGPCPEGRMCCGQQQEVRQKYAQLKQEAVCHG